MSWFFQAWRFHLALVEAQSFGSRRAMAHQL
jgi:hypothetical protein